ncbi:MAG: family 16 glycosylhydrolase [Caldisericia bacterium]|nr:family 16 glycosylhydrolase [Caldisericia bacterium]MDD4614849.1 family 16 glycosylhydrolase [Caldisericia bacterium]
MISRKTIRLSSIFIFMFVFSLVGQAPMSQSESPRSLQFAQQEWLVTDSHWSKIAPGSNYFSGSEKNVSVDSDGTLHLTLRYDTNLGAWTCAQIESKQYAQYGTYSFIIDQNLERLDQNAVLGVFFYKSDPDYPNARAEIDLEFSKWGFPKQNEEGEWVDIDYNSWYVLWPSWEEGVTPVPQIINGFSLEMSNYEKTLHEIQWEDYILSFRSYVFDPFKHKLGDLKRHYPYYQAEYQQTSFDDNALWIPLEEDKMKLMINLWLIEEASDPFDCKDIEITLQMKYQPPGQ